MVLYVVSAIVICIAVWLLIDRADLLEHSWLTYFLGMPGMDAREIRVAAALTIIGNIVMLCIS